MLVVKSTLDQRIKDLLSQQDFGRTTTPLDATKQISNVSAVIKRSYDPDIIPEDIGRTRVNYLTGARRVSKGTTAVSDRVSTASIIPTPSLVGWTTDIIFSATDYNTVERSSGNIKLADGTSYAVNAGNTGNISAVTYIYYDGTTTLKTTTTPQTAVGATKLMVCVAKNSTSPTLAQFQAFGTLGNGVLITADNIAADTITANQIAANTITATELNISTLSAISADLGTITAGTITGALIRTAASGQRVVMDQTNNRIQFYDSSNNDCGYLRGISVGGIGTFMAFSNSIYSSGGALLNGAIFPGADASHDIGSADYQWNNVYLKDNLTIDSYVLDENSGYLRRRGNFIPYLTGSSTNKTTNASIKVMLGSVEYYINVLAV